MNAIKIQMYDDAGEIMEIPWLMVDGSLGRTLGVPLQPDGRGDWMVGDQDNLEAVVSHIQAKDMQEL